MMQKQILLAFFAISFALPGQGNAQLGLSAEGYTGLGNMGTAETLGKGRKIINILTRYSQFGNADPRGETGEVFFAYGQGLTDRFDVSIQIPYIGVEAGKNNFGKLAIAAKYRILDTDNLLLSIFPAIQVPLGGVNSLIGTENLTGRIEAGAKIKSGAPSFYANLGYGRLDLVQSSSNRMQNTGVLLMSGGLSFQAGEPIILFVEAIGLRELSNENDDLYFQIGGIWMAGNKFILKGSAGLGLPSADRADTDKRAVFGFGYFIH